MPWCDSDECKKPGEYIGTPQHSFSGYGFYVVYHPECCPREVDGTICDLLHPDDEDGSSLTKR